MKKNKFIEVIGTIVFASLLFFAFNTNASPRVIQKVAVQVTTAAENIAIQASLSPPTITKVNVESGFCSLGAVNNSYKYVSMMNTSTGNAASLPPNYFTMMSSSMVMNANGAASSSFLGFSMMITTGNLVAISPHYFRVMNISMVNDITMAAKLSDATFTPVDYCITNN